MRVARLLLIPILASVCFPASQGAVWNETQTHRLLLSDSRRQRDSQKSQRHAASREAEKKPEGASTQEAANIYFTGFGSAWDSWWVNGVAVSLVVVSLSMDLSGFNWMEYALGFRHEHKSVTFHALWLLADLLFYLGVDVLNLVGFAANVYRPLALISVLAVCSHLSRLAYIKWKMKEAPWEVEEDQSIILKPENVFLDVSFPLPRVCMRFSGQCVLFSCLLVDMPLLREQALDLHRHESFFLAAVPIQFLMYTQMGKTHIGNLFDWIKLFESTHWAKDETCQPYEERINRCVLSLRFTMALAVNLLFFDAVIFLMPIILMTSHTALDFVKDSFVLACITTLDTETNPPKLKLTQQKVNNDTNCFCTLQVGQDGGSREVELGHRRTDGNNPPLRGSWSTMHMA